MIIIRDMILGVPGRNHCVIAYAVSEAGNCKASASMPALACASRYFLPGELKAALGQKTLTATLRVTPSPYVLANACSKQLILK